MRAEERDAIIETYFAEDMKLLKAKGHDYSGDADCLDNLRDFGLEGIIVRIGDKYKRLKNFAKGGNLQVKEEGVRDTLVDLSNYSFLARIFLDGKDK